VGRRTSVFVARAAMPLPGCCGKWVLLVTSAVAARRLFDFFADNATGQFQILTKKYSLNHFFSCVLQIIRYITLSPILFLGDAYGFMVESKAII
jgi:hypothetical protein